MKIEQFVVSVDAATAIARGLSVAEDQKTVEVGTVDVKIYSVEDWNTIPSAERERIVVDSNRQRAQDAMNKLRAEWKQGGPSVKNRMAELVKMLGTASDEEKPEIIAELTQLSAKLK